MLYAISLVPGLFALGLLPLVLVPVLREEWAATLDQRWRLVALVFASGFLLNYLLVVAFGWLWTGLAAGVVIAFCCLIVVATGRGHGKTDWLRLGTRPMLLFALVITAFGFVVLIEPLVGWDARTIWFYHAKMFYYANGLVRSAFPPDGVFPDYPHLVPVLAAQVAGLAGFWNEQLPKFSLVVLLLPVLAVTISFWRAPFAIAALLIIVWAKLAPELCSGYMDGALAIYGLFGVMLIGSWLATGSPLDLATGAVLTSVTLGLKNEGSLLVVVVLCCAIPAAVLTGWSGTLLLPRRRFGAIGIGCIVLLASASGASWLVIREFWGFHNYLQLGFHSLPSIVQRLRDPAAVEMIARSTLIANALVTAAATGFSAAGLACIFRTGRLAEPLFCLVVAVLYLAGMELVYFATPLDLKWHLATSADRTTMLPIMLFIAPVILLLRDQHRWRIPWARLSKPNASQPDKKLASIQ